MAASLRDRGGAPPQQMDEGQKRKLHESQSALAKMMAASTSVGKFLVPGRRFVFPSAEPYEDDMEQDSDTLIPLASQPDIRTSVPAAIRSTRSGGAIGVKAPTSASVPPVTAAVSKPTSATVPVPAVPSSRPSYRKAAAVLEVAASDLPSPVPAAGQNKTAATIGQYRGRATATGPDGSKSGPTVQALPGLQTFSAKPIQPVNLNEGESAAVRKERRMILEADQVFQKEVQRQEAERMAKQVKVPSRMAGKSARKPTVLMTAVSGGRTRGQSSSIGAGGAMSEPIAGPDLPTSSAKSKRKQLLKPTKVTAPVQAVSSGRRSARKGAAVIPSQVVPPEPQLQPQPESKKKKPNQRDGSDASATMGPPLANNAANQNLAPAYSVSSGSLRRGRSFVTEEVPVTASEHQPLQLPEVVSRDQVQSGRSDAAAAVPPTAPVAATEECSGSRSGFVRNLVALAKGLFNAKSVFSAKSGIQKSHESKSAQSKRPVERSATGHLICKHGVRESLCKKCRGGGICTHGLQRSWCRECGGSARCEHGKQKSKCKTCGGSAFCDHGKYRYRCKECAGVV